jgi:hypothetical protein
MGRYPRAAGFRIARARTMRLNLKRSGVFREDRIGADRIVSDLTTYHGAIPPS